MNLCNIVKRKLNKREKLLRERVNYYAEKQKIDGNYYLMCCKENLAKVNNFGYYDKMDVKNFLNIYEAWDKRNFISLEFGTMLENYINDDNYYLLTREITKFDDNTLDTLFDLGVSMECTYLNSAIFAIILMKSECQKNAGGVLILAPKNEDIYHYVNDKCYIKPEYILGYYTYVGDRIVYTSKEAYLTQAVDSTTRNLKKEN